mmetsp:Transcript_101232/g.281824  ORF Transcript_101232/g.281824 Transcript_101232/m.281824 type:complete len:165 (-) Transcript_101232:224-718(-)
MDSVMAGARDRSDMWRLEVLTLGGVAQWNLDITPSVTGHDIKEHLAGYVGLDVEDFTLINGNRVLEDSRAIIDQDIVDGGTLTLVKGHPLRIGNWVPGRISEAMFHMEDQAPGNAAAGAVFVSHAIGGEARLERGDARRGREATKPQLSVTEEVFARGQTCDQS